MSDSFDLTGNNTSNPDVETTEAGTPSGGEPTDKVAPELTDEQKRLTGPGGPLNETQFIDESVDVDLDNVDTKDVDFVYPTNTDPMRQLPSTSRYLDDVEREKAEILRAKIEDREPDLENPPAAQGTPLVTVAQIKATNFSNLDDVQTVTLPVTVAPAV